MYTKTTILSFLIAFTLIFTGCKTDKKPDPAPLGKREGEVKVNNDQYTSLADFYSQNEVKMQTYSIDATTGGDFTSPKGTKVTIPASCFVTSGNTAVTGTVTIQFKDIYSKSDMLLSDIPTNYFDGTPLKSGGEFFINALQNDEQVRIAAGKAIDIEQPLMGLAADEDMEPMVRFDSIQGGANGGAWSISPTNTLLMTSSSYIFSLYSFGAGDGGIWCNSDNPYFFQSYPTTTLTVNEDQDGTNQDVFLVFHDLNSMIHVYWNGTSFPYAGAPVGAECTVVVIGIKDEKLCASFTPVTISAGLTVDQQLTEITTEEFKIKIDALNE